MNADTRTYTVPDISCDHCKRSIEDHVTPIDGVDTVTVDDETVTITGGARHRGRRLHHPAVRHATDRLTFDEAHAVWLVDVCGLTYADAAAETGTNPKRFANRLHTARTTIRKAVT